jgi:hypothetical protein
MAVMLKVMPLMVPSLNKTSARIGKALTIPPPIGVELWGREGPRGNQIMKSRGGTKLHAANLEHARALAGAMLAHINEEVSHG